MAYVGCVVFMLSFVSVQSGFSRSFNNSCNISLREQNLHDARWSLLQDGDFILQSIVPIGSSDNFCDKITHFGLLSMLSFQFAIDQVNMNSTLLDGYQLGFQIDDSCEMIPAVMARGIEIASQYRHQSVCHTRTCNSQSVKLKKVTACIGTYNSFTSIPLASLLGLYSVPIISPSASSRLLSKKSLYKSFFRIIPSDKHQALAMVHLLKHYGWRYVYAIGSDDNYGKLGLSTLKEYASGNGMCIVADDFVPYMTDDMYSKVEHAVKKMAAIPNAKVVVLFVYDIQMELILKSAEKRGLNRLWLTSDAVRLFEDGKLNFTHEKLAGMFRISPKSIKVPGMHEYVKSKIETETHCNRFLSLYLQQNFACQINTTNINCENETLNTMVDKLLQYNSYVSGNTMNAVYAVVHALKSLLIAKCNYSRATHNKHSCPPHTPLSPEELTHELFHLNFSSILNTTIIFNEDGDPSYPSYDVENIQLINGKLQYVKIGQWNDRDTFQYLNGTTIVWPSWTHQKAPKSTCNDDCVPGQFVSARTECCWSCQLCPPGQISETINAENCTRCPRGYRTHKGSKECIKFDVVYLTLQQPAGIAIVIVSIIGIILLAIISYAHCKLNGYLIHKVQRMSYLHYLSIIQAALAFLYGNVLLTERNEYYCTAIFSLASLLSTGFCILLLARTHAFLKLVQKFIHPVSGLSLALSHSLLAMIPMLLHVILTVITGIKYHIELQTLPSTDIREIIKQCDSRFNPLQLFTYVIYPPILLFIATVTAYKEREADKQTYSESRFLNFTTIALSIVMVVFFPTFKLVIGIYRSIVLAFFVDIFALIYVGCLLLPKLYFAFTNRIKTKKENRQVSATVASSSAGELPGQQETKRSKLSQAKLVTVK